MYGPLLSGAVALIWWDDTGLSFPVLADLFNKGSYPYIHDLAFNLFALLLPPLLLAWAVVRRALLGCGLVHWRLSLRLSCSPPCCP